MKIAIIGAGGVGGYFGGRLADAGDDVIFLARGEHLKALQRDGLHVESIRGDFHVAPVQAVDDIASIGPVDFVIVAVKTWQLSEISEAMISLLTPTTRVVSLLNGVDAPHQLADVLGRKHVVGGYCRIVAFVASPGHIRHTGIEPDLFFGRLDGRADDQLAVLRERFLASGVGCEIPDDISVAMWRKFLFVVPVGSVGAATRLSVGDYRSIPESRKMLEAAMREIWELALARGIELPEQSIEQTLAFTDSLPPEATSSLQRDIIDGRPSELEAWTGSVVRMAKAANVSVPVHRALYASLKPQEVLARATLTNP